jgi:hypothetical protein
MKRSARLARHGTRLTPLGPVYAVGDVALSLTLAVLQPRPAAADPKRVIVVPAVPANLEVPAGNQVYLEGHSVGVGDRSRDSFPPHSRIRGEFLRRARSVTFHKPGWRG